MALLQGNTYNLPIQIDQITNDTIENVVRGQFIFGKLTKFYGEEDDVVTWDSERQCFIVPLTQEETFSLKGTVQWQVRIRFVGGQVDGTRPAIENIYSSITTEVL